MALSDDTVGAIRAMILDGRLRAGDKLPIERQLAAELGVSRGTLREAVRSLTMIGVLDTRQGDGTYVTSLEPRLLLEAMSFVVDLHQDASVLDLFEVRRILEPAAAAMATRRVTDQDVDALNALLAEVGRDTSVEDLVAHDVKFHGFINELSRNSYLSSILDSLSSSTLRARIWRGLTEQNSVARTLAEHQAIVDAMAAGDVDLVRSCVVVHISGVERWLEKAGATELAGQTA